jgi:hypothetical protein
MSQLLWIKETMFRVLQGGRKLAIHEVHMGKLAGA